MGNGIPARTEQPLGIANRRLSFVYRILIPSAHGLGCLAWLATASGSGPPTKCDITRTGTGVSAGRGGQGSMSSMSVCAGACREAA